MTNRLNLLVAVAAVIAASWAMAQPGGGYGWGPGMGPGCDAAAQGTGNCPGPGGGYGHGGGYGPGGGQGMNLLSSEERTQFHDAMHAVTTVDECNALVAQHKAVLAQRAKENGVTAPQRPKRALTALAETRSRESILPFDAVSPPMRGRASRPGGDNL
jgi:hypothetical protein